VVNIQSGFFRGSVLISALWVAGLGALALVFVPEMYQSGYWYVLELRKDTDISKIDWKRPLYDLILSPRNDVNVMPNSSPAYLARLPVSIFKATRSIAVSIRSVRV
jgi:hypothetical protein